MKRIAFILLAWLGTTACGGNGRQAAERRTSEGNGSSGARAMLASVHPVARSTYRPGDTVSIGYVLAPHASRPDSVVVLADGERLPGNDSMRRYVLAPDRISGRVAYRVEAFREGKKEVKVGEFTVLPRQKPVRYGYRVIRSYPHDRNAYTQGLFWHDGYLYEGTGREGKSVLRKTDPVTGNVLQEKKLDDRYFGEGIVLLDGKIYQLTWQHNRGFVYDADTFEQAGEFGYAGEGWGLATDGQRLYMSDGTEKIREIFPDGFRQERTFGVYTDAGAVRYLNELEWIDGELWANVFMTDEIVRIDPKTGAVTGIVDLSGLLPAAERDADTDVLNGIAWDAEGRRLFVTGKNWSRVFEIALVKK